MKFIYEFAGWQETVAVRYVAVDVGRDLQLACADENVLPEDSNARVMWIREGREDGQIERLKVDPNGMLELLNVSVHDAGNYSCTLDGDHDAVKASINVEVRSASAKSFAIFLINRAQHIEIVLVFKETEFIRV